MAMSDLFIGIAHEKALELVQQILEYSCDKVNVIDRDFGAGRVSVLVYEKYYMRVSSYVSLTVVLASRQEQPGITEINAIGSGGGNGIMGITWGAEDDITESLLEKLDKYAVRQS